MKWQRTWGQAGAGPKTMMGEVEGTEKQKSFLGTLGWEAHVQTSMATINLEPPEAMAQAMGHRELLGLEALPSSKVHVLLYRAVLVLFGAFISCS